MALRELHMDELVWVKVEDYTSRQNSRRRRDLLF
jgi:hypothetical protein